MASARAIRVSSPCPLPPAHTNRRRHDLSKYHRRTCSRFLGQTAASARRQDINPTNSIQTLTTPVGHGILFLWRFYTFHLDTYHRICNTLQLVLRYLEILDDRFCCGVVDHQFQRIFCLIDYPDIFKSGASDRF
jgi:hypothetical protein